MLILAGLVSAMCAGVAVIAINLAKAPEGYEDQDGFHFVGKPKSGSRAPRQEREPVRNRFISLQLPRPTR